MCKGSERPGVSLQGSVLWTSWPKIWDLTCCRCEALKHLYILTLTRLMIMQMCVYDALWFINRRWTGSCSSSRLMGKSCIFQKQLRCIWVCHRWEFNHSDNTHNSGECEFITLPYQGFYWEIQCVPEVWAGACLISSEFKVCVFDRKPM